MTGENVCEVFISQGERQGEQREGGEREIPLVRAEQEHGGADDHAEPSLFDADLGDAAEFVVADGGDQGDGCEEDCVRAAEDDPDDGWGEDETGEEALHYKGTATSSTTSSVRAGALWTALSPPKRRSRLL